MMFDSRLVIYRHKGKQYALPVALTPVVLYYRVDLFEKAGVQVPLKTWDDFMVAGKKLTRDKQFMTFVQPESWTDLRVHIRQRGGGLHDENGNVIFDQPSGVEALEFLADLKHKHKIAVDAPAGPALWGAVKEGAVAALWGADWYATFLSDNAPELSGKWAAQYLPAVKAGDRKTSAAGGTGTALLKTSKQLDEAARFLEWTFLDPNRVVVRYQMIDLYPPLKEALKDPRMREPRPYYGGQRLGELFAELAPDVPTWYNHPAQGEGVPAVQRLAIRPVMEGKKSVKEAVAETAAELRKLTEQYNK
ncbi:MAG: extracellular solute-binding protein [Chloroflexi bacterium]|nr:extracellular solute-binding protein [Chloroflexota bacterium]